MSDMNANEMICIEWVRQVGMDGHGRYGRGASMEAGAADLAHGCSVVLYQVACLTEHSLLNARSSICTEVRSIEASRHVCRPGSKD